MVGVISTNDLGQSKSSELSKPSESQKTTEEISKSKLAIKKETTKQNIQNQEEIKKEKQAPPIAAKTIETKSETNTKRLSRSGLL